MESGTISDEQISASSEWGDVSQGRLHSQPRAWSAAQNNVNQWLQVDLGNQHTKVTRAATQGNKYIWVKKYKLQYGNDESSLQYYREEGQNTDTVKLVHFN